MKVVNSPEAASPPTPFPRPALAGERAGMSIWRGIVLPVAHPHQLIGTSALTWIQVDWSANAHIQMWNLSTKEYDPLPNPFDNDQKMISEAR